MREKSNLPQCCGHEMSVKLDLGRFIETSCDNCGDTVYIKKLEAPKPHMIDD